MDMGESSDIVRTNLAKTSGACKVSHNRSHALGFSDGPSSLSSHGSSVADCLELVRQKAPRKKLQCKAPLHLAPRLVTLLRFSLKPWP